MCHRWNLLAGNRRSYPRRRETRQVRCSCGALSSRTPSLVLVTVGPDPMLIFAASPIGGLIVDFTDDRRAGWSRDCVIPFACPTTDSGTPNKLGPNLEHPSRAIGLHCIPLENLPAGYFVARQPKRPPICAVTFKFRWIYREGGAVVPMHATQWGHRV